MRKLITMVAGAVVVATLSAAVTWTIADRTQPSLCFVEENGVCAYEFTPRRGDEVTIRLDLEGHPYRHETVPESCIRDAMPLICPAWMERGNSKS